MDISNLQNTFIDYIKDQPILHPCFRLTDVKRALSHIEYNLGLIPQPVSHISTTFFYLLKRTPVAVMVTPVRYDEDRMSYAFQVLFLDRLPQVNTLPSSPTHPQSSWHILPVQIYLQLLQKVDVKDVKSLTDAFTAKGLLPQQSVYLEPLDVPAEVNTEYSWEEAELLLTLEQNGFPTPTYSQFSSLLFWGIKTVFVRQLAMYGYNYFSLDELETVWRCKIPLRYLKNLADAGYGSYSADEYHSLYASQVNPDTVATLSDKGYTMLSCTELIRMSQNGPGRLLPQQASTSR